MLKARVRNLLELKRRNDIELAVAASRGQRLEADRLAAVVESASDGIVTINAAGRVALMNAAAGRMLEADHLSAPGQAAREVLGDRMPHLEGDDTAPPQTVLLPQAEGGALPAEVSVSSVGQGDVRLTTLVFRDLTERQLLHAESSARAAAEAANRAKALMISYLAHEIGNPLNCILGFAQLLRVDKAAPLSQSQAQRLSMIEIGCSQLNTIVSDLSALGHLELGKLKVNCQPMDARTAVNGALQTAAGLAERSGVALSLDDAGTAGADVLADANRLRQCLVNLVSNAIKYNRRGGRVDVVLRDLDEDLEIAISDTGLGMSEEQISHLFEPFNRLGRQDSALPGTGLGLVITRQLIEAMGGRLSVTSKVGEGSCFALCLPMA